MDSKSSTYSVFLDNYTRGFNEYLNNISGSFFKRIDFDKSNISKKAVGDSILLSQIAQIDALENVNADNYTKLKSAGKILQDITPNVISNADYEIKRSGANILNSFFAIAKQTGDEELLKTAAAISGTVKTIQSKRV